MYTIEKIKNIIEGILQLYRLDDDGLLRPFFLIELYAELKDDKQLQTLFEQTLYQSAKVTNKWGIAEVCYLSAEQLGFDLSNYDKIEFIKKEKVGLPSLSKYLRKTIEDIEIDMLHYLDNLKAAILYAKNAKVHLDTIEFLEELKRKVEEKLQTDQTEKEKGSE